MRLPKEADLTALLRECSAVAGANSTVLSEGRLMYGKPAFVYGRSWFTNHSELFFPLRAEPWETLPRLEWLENPSGMRCEHLDDYADWFLAQLLGRQLETKVAEADPERLKRKMWRLSYRSFMVIRGGDFRKRLRQARVVLYRSPV